MTALHNSSPELSHPNRLWSMKTKTMTETQTQVSPRPEAKATWPQQNIPIEDIEVEGRLRGLVQATKTKTTPVRRIPGKREPMNTPE